MPACKATSLKFRASVSLALAATILVFSGCSKAKKSGTETSVPSAEIVKQAERDHMPVYAPTVAVPAVATASSAAPDLAELDRGLLRWLMRNRRKPANFEDFAATAGVTIPPPPTGKKYVIASNMHIQLVNK